MSRQNLVADELLVVDIKNSEWIDLSSGHEQVRKSLEKNIENSCVNKVATSPTMVKGAFRIGKTALLSYLFHYSWTTLSVPTFLLDLDDIIIKAKEYLNKCGLKIKIKLFKNCDHIIPVEGSSLGLGFLRKNLL